MPPAWIVPARPLSSAATPVHLRQNLKRARQAVRERTPSVPAFPTPRVTDGQALGDSEAASRDALSQPLNHDLPRRQLAPAYTKLLSMH